MRPLADWLLTPECAAVHLPTETAVIADLHLGYGAARRAAGEAVPVLPLEVVLAPLARLFARGAARRLIIAGDLFEDGPHEETATALGGWLRRERVELVGVVPGNHDRGLSAGGALPVCPEGIDLGGWRVVHGDGELPAGRLVHGHAHPCVRWGRLSAACFLVADARIVLPAFSPDARGANVLREACWAAFRCCAVAGEEVINLGDVADLRRRR
jgi:putative SbcD/Mre11-related phosphoesterase